MFLLLRSGQIYAANGLQVFGREMLAHQLGADFKAVADKVLQRTLPGLEPHGAKLPLDFLGGGGFTRVGGAAHNIGNAGNFINLGQCALFALLQHAEHLALARVGILGNNARYAPALAKHIEAGVDGHVGVVIGVF